MKIMQDFENMRVNQDGIVKLGSQNFTKREN